MDSSTQHAGRRRTALCVPATEAHKIQKAAASIADEIVVDLEDAVPIEAKDAARGHIAALAPRQNGSVAVRVNALSTPWFAEDVRACLANPAVSSIVVPKVDRPEDVARIEHVVEQAIHSDPGERRHQVRVQALIESALGLTNVDAIARSGSRLEALILGYADLAASLGRSHDTDWQFARDRVLVAARAGDLQAVDGPHLSIAADERFAQRVSAASKQGFDGTWVIHPQQLEVARAAFTPADAEVEEARTIVEVMEAAVRDGRGAVSWRGRMLDEALVVSARRVLARAWD